MSPNIRGAAVYAGLILCLVAPSEPAFADEPAPASAKVVPGEAKYWEAMRLLAVKDPASMAAGRSALQTSADLEFSHAQILLGNCYLAGTYGFIKDPPKGASYFRLAAEAG